MNAFQSKNLAIVKLSGFTMGRIGLATGVSVKKVSVQVLLQYQSKSYFYIIGQMHEVCITKCQHLR